MRLSPALLAVLATAAIALVPSGARASEPPLPPLPGSPGSSGNSGSGPTAADLPQTGDFQLFLNAPPAVAGFEASNPFGAEAVGSGTRGISGTSFAGLTSLGLGLDAGLGYCFTDLLEGGIALAIDYSGISPENSFAFGAEPFIKANLGRMVTTSGHFNPFVQFGLVLGEFSASSINGSASTGLVGFDLNVGIEFLMTRTWGITLYLPLTLIDATSDGTALFGFGVGYGFAAYF